MADRSPNPEHRPAPAGEGDGLAGVESVAGSNRGLWDELNELREAADASSSHCQRVYLTFLLFAAYVGLTTWSTTHAQLLRDDALDLPVLDVGLPIVEFYAVAPVLLVLFHFNLLLQLFLLSDKLRRLDARIRRLDPGETGDQRSLLYPFTFSHMLVGKPSSRPVSGLLTLAVWLSMYAAPPFLVIWMQITFLPRHLPAVSALQSAFVLLDLALIWLFWPRVAGTTGGWRDWWREAGRKRSLRGLVHVTFTASIAFVSIFVAVVPGRGMDRVARSLGLSDLADSFVTRNLKLPPGTYVSEEPPAELLAAYLRAGRDVGAAWNDHAKGLDLQERDLRFADLSMSRFVKANLEDALLEGANLEHAQLEGANLIGADLRGANLQHVRLNGAKLNGAWLQGALLTSADLDGAELSGAELAGAVLQDASLQGANLAGTHLEASKLANASLEGANLGLSTLVAADLTQVRLQGADLDYADLRGADPQEADLSEASFAQSEVWGFDFSKAADLSLADLRTIRRDAPDDAWLSQLREKLRAIPDEERRKDALATLAGLEEPRLLRPPRRDAAPDGACLGDAGTSCGENYTEVVAERLAALACRNSYIGEGVARRATVEPEPALAHRLLAAAEAAASGRLPCPGLLDLPDAFELSLRLRTQLTED